MKKIAGSIFDGRENGYLFVLLLGLIIWLPLPLGSNRPWAWAIMETISFAALGICLGLMAMRNQPIPPVIKKHKTVILLLLAWLAQMLFQLAPIPAGLARFLSPASYSMYSMAGQSSWISISVERHETLAEFLKFASYVALLILTMILVNTPERLKKVLVVFVAIGFAEGLYGMLSTLTGLEYIWWTPKIYYKGYSTGTFINRNHFAGHLEMIIPLGLAMLMVLRENISQYPSKMALAALWAKWLTGRQGRLMFYTVTMIAAVMSSGSRAGMFCLLATMVALSIVVVTRKGLRNADSMIALVAGACLIVAVLWLGLGKLPDRYLKSDTDIETRTAVWKDTLKIVSDYMWMGSGAGTFKYVIPLYRSDRQNLAYYDHAHSVYLELASNQGLTGLALFLAAVATIQFRILREYTRRRDRLKRWALLAISAGAMSVLMHDIVDFNLYIPANGAYLFILMGAGLATASMPHTHRPTNKRELESFGHKEIGE